jgi:chaperonin GroEL
MQDIQFREALTYKTPKVIKMYSQHNNGIAQTWKFNHISQAELEAHREDLRDMIEEELEDMDTAATNSNSSDTLSELDSLRKRLARLNRGMAVIKLGGASDLEIGATRDRLLDALCATRCALEEGCVAGGGSVFCRIADEVQEIYGGGSDNITDNNAHHQPPLTFDARVGVEILAGALRAPIHQLAANAGLDGAVVCERLRDARGSLRDRDGDGDIDFKNTHGLNLRTLEYCDLIESGVIDPVKVLRTALVDAVSVAGTGALSDVVVLKLRKWCVELMHGINAENMDGFSKNTSSKFFKI